VALPLNSSLPSWSSALIFWHRPLPLSLHPFPALIPTSILFLIPSPHSFPHPYHYLISPIFNPYSAILFFSISLFYSSLANPNLPRYMYGTPYLHFLVFRWGWIMISVGWTSRRNILFYPRAFHDHRNCEE
jgi:hypothetical protein